MIVGSVVSGAPRPAVAAGASPGLRRAVPVRLCERRLTHFALGRAGQAIRCQAGVAWWVLYRHGSELLSRLDPLAAPRRTHALAALCEQLNQAQARYPGTDLVLRYDVQPHPPPA